MKKNIRVVVYGILLVATIWAFSLTPYGHEVAVGLGLDTPVNDPNGQHSTLVCKVLDCGPAR